jgi:hypothetical protein
MGADFILKAKDTFRKGWDREREKLCTSDLFTSKPTDIRTILVKPVNGFLFIDCDYELHAEAEGIFVYQNRQLVGVTEKAPKSILDAVKAVGGKALGTLKRIRQHSGQVDIAISTDD